MDKKNEDKKFYRILAQTDSVTMSAITSRALLSEEAEETAKELTQYPTKPYVAQAICTEEEWEEGKVNFCPRCGAADPFHSSYDEFDCSDCGASGSIQLSILDTEEVSD